MKVCGISFKENGKVYNFYHNNIDIDVNDYAIVETEKGDQYGKVIFIDEREINKPLKNLLRKATKKDQDVYFKNLSDSKNALQEAKEAANELNLNMHFTDCNYTFDRKQLIFNFLADERVDFRDLLKVLAGKFKTRIELHQIGVRDKSKEIGGIGQCGYALCCSSFLNNIEAISINMAKNQNIALNPTKINGACGRLLCCLAYEDEHYAKCRKELPNVGERVKYEDKTGTVVSINFLVGSYKIDINGEIKEVFINCCNGCKK